MYVCMISGLFFIIYCRGYFICCSYYCKICIIFPKLVDLFDFNLLISNSS